MKGGGQVVCGAEGRELRGRQPGQLAADFGHGSSPLPLGVAAPRAFHVGARMPTGTVRRTGPTSAVRNNGAAPRSKAVIYITIFTNFRKNQGSLSLQIPMGHHNPGAPVSVALCDTMPELSQMSRFRLTTPLLSAIVFYPSSPSKGQRLFGGG
jgi:hypothetical protein